MVNPRHHDYGDGRLGHTPPVQAWPTAQGPSNLPIPAYGNTPTAYPGSYAARPVRSAGAAVTLEVVPGLFGIFGIGNIYAGRTATGVTLMLTFWVAFWINVALIFVFIGFITMPLTWVAYLIAGPILAARAVERHNAGG
jgi:TM2 domain-containing membrane protein YozV